MQREMSRLCRAKMRRMERGNLSRALGILWEHTSTSGDNKNPSSYGAPSRQRRACAPPHNVSPLSQATDGKKTKGRVSMSASCTY
jgi:hypothetical protein